MRKNEENESKIQYLAEYCKKLEQIDSISDDDLSDVYELVWQARCDHRVWKGGVNEAYLNFIATKPAPSISAVLLSIIWLSIMEW